MIGVADFLDGLLGGAMLLGLSVALGGVAWRLLVLTGAERPPVIAVRRCRALIAGGAAGLAAVQGGALALKVWVLSELVGPGALGAYAATPHFAAGAARAVLAVALAAWALRSRPGLDPIGRSAVPVALALAIAVSGAWLTHAAARLDHRAGFMALTVAHQIAAAVWVGGLAQLAGLWRLVRRHPDLDGLWRVVVARFSRVALAAVAALVLSAALLALAEVQSWGGLIGTGYGSLVAAKSGLLGAALLLAVFSRHAARAGGAAGAPALRTRLPYLVEAELLLAVVILFTAASLASQPPARDVVAERASWGELVEVFRPKWPDLRTPTMAAMRADRAEAAADETRARSAKAYRWSNFSHNVAGLILLGMSGLALAGLAIGGGWARAWPLGFLLLAAFVVLRASANEGTWPFGTTRLAEVGAEGIQHRIAGVLVLGLGLLEWRARASGRRLSSRWLFPSLAALGAILLVTHSHTAFQPKAAYLVQVTHVAMGALAAVIAAARWLELRLEPPADRAAGWAAVMAMTVVALVLVFYREANVVLTTE